jgi:hypothetical protein
MAIFRMHPNGFETPRSPEPVPSLAQIVIQQLNTPSRQATDLPWKVYIPVLVGITISVLRPEFSDVF